MWKHKMINILWGTFLALLVLSLVCKIVADDTWSYARERTYAKLALILIICAMFCGGLAMYLTNGACKVNPESVSVECYKGDVK